MVTEDLIRKKFVHDTISSGINLIYNTQERVVSSFLNSCSGNLLSSIQRRPFTTQTSDTSTIYFIRILPYLRFLDIRYRNSTDRISRHIRSKLALYNRTVWGVLYNETFPQLQYGFSDEIKRGIRRELEESLTRK